MSVGMFLIVILVIYSLNNIINKIVKIIEWRVQYITSTKQYKEDDEL